MKKSRKAIALMMLVLLMTGSWTLVNAASRLERTIGGVDIVASSVAGSNMATGSTYCKVQDNSVSCSVEGDYGAAHLITYASYTDSKSQTQPSSATIGFVAPSGYQTLSVQCHHSVSSYGETWNGDTSQTYPH